MRSIGQFIEYNFEGGASRGYNYRPVLPEAKTRFLNIPVGENKEFPICCNKTIFPDVHSTISIKLKIGHGNTTYTSFDAAFKDVFICAANDGVNILQRMTIVKKDIPYKYYVGNGIIMNPDIILAMLSWKYCESDNPSHSLLKETPIVRIDPWCFRNDTPPMNRFLSTKFIKEALAARVSVYDGAHYINVQPKIIIEPIPFKFERAVVPNASTSNAELLNPLLNHVDEIIP